MARPISPYHHANFYDDALARGRHRDIVGGSWEETGRLQMTVLVAAGLKPQHHLLDIGAGSLRLGRKAVEFLEPGHYWATDLSRPLMLAGYEKEIADKRRLDPKHLVEDARFDFPDVPDSITHAIAFAVFTHLPADHLALALGNVRARFARIEALLFTVFLAPDAASFAEPLRQAGGVVTHGGRAPYHMLAEDVAALAQEHGFAVVRVAGRMPRGQVLFEARPL